MSGKCDLRRHSSCAIIIPMATPIAAVSGLVTTLTPLGSTRSSLSDRWRKFMLRGIAGCIRYCP